MKVFVYEKNSNILLLLCIGERTYASKSPKSTHEAVTWGNRHFFGKSKSTHKSPSQVRGLRQVPHPR